MMALASDRALCALEFWKPDGYAAGCAAGAMFAPYEVATTQYGHERRGIDRAVLRGEPAEDPPLDMRAPTSSSCGAALRTIPRGATTSYG